MRMHFRDKTFTRALTGAVVATMTLSAPLSAQADAGSFIGGVVGGIIGGAIGSAATKERTVVRERVVTRPSVNTYEREQNRNVQNALNYFGFPAGTPDGVMGRRSRSAISDYQATMGFPVTGYIADYERDFLLSAFARAQSNTMQAAQLAAQYGGQRGILIAYRGNQSTGAVMNVQPMIPQPQVIVQQPQPQVFVQQPQPQVVIQQQQPQPQVVINNTAPAPQAPVAAAPAPAPQTQEVAAAAPEPAAPAVAMMPSFIGGAVEASMASYCNKTSLVTSTNGGMLTAASMSQDVGVALGEQFCLARTYAIAEGEQLTASVQGVTLAQMQEQCGAFAPTMREYVAAMVAKNPADATSDLQTFVINTGMNPSQLSSNAKICLSIGYRSDNADVALASALVLVGLGEAAYGEMLAHHMAQGFGAPKRLDRAADWYDATVSAIEGGAVRVVAPGQSERPAMLRAAAVSLRGGTPTRAAPQQAVLPSFGMPTAPAQTVNN